MRLEPLHFKMFSQYGWCFINRKRLQKSCNPSSVPEMRVVRVHFSIFLAILLSCTFFLQGMKERSEQKLNFLISSCIILAKCCWLLCSEKYTRSQYLEFISRKGCTLLEVFLCHESRPLIHCSERSKMILPNYCNVCILPFAGVVAKSSATTVHNISCPYHKNNYSIRYECAKYVTKSNECHHLRVCSSRIHRSRRPVSRLQPAKKLKIRI